LTLHGPFDKPKPTVSSLRDRETDQLISVTRHLKGMTDAVGKLLDLKLEESKKKDKGE
jgi:hypothetical protein